jgi:hypothetical protein
MNIRFAYKFYPLNIAEISVIIFYFILMLYYLRIVSTNYKAPELID